MRTRNRSHTLMAWRWLIVGTLVLGFLLALQTAPVSARQFGFHIQKTDRGDEGGWRLVPAPKPYVYETSFEFIGLNAPQDIFYDDDHKALWVADTGNSRILKLNKEGDILLEVKEIRGGEEEELQKLQETGGNKFFQPEGVFVNPEGDLFVADTGNKRVLQFYPDGTLKRVFPAPASVLLGEDFDYRPTKVVQDARDYLYIVNRSDYRGMILLDTDGDFRGFFAPNEVGFSLRRVLIRLFATEAQRRKLSKELPAPHSNIYLTDDGFIYSSTTYEQINQIKKLNGVGTDVMNRDALGDHQYGFIINRSDRAVIPNFVDLTVSDQGIISAIDSHNGIVYQYDDDRNLLTMFGGKGEENGKFGYPISIEIDENGLLYVLDKDRNNIQVFQPTYFATLVHRASELYVEGKYQEAEGPWREALRLNTNYNLAHSGIGKAFEKIGRWEEALQEYYFGEDRGGFSTIFGKLRHEWVRDHFGLAVLFVFAGVVFVTLLSRYLSRLLRKPVDEAGPVTQTIQMIWTVAFHPWDGFWMLKREGRGSVTVGLLLVGLTFVLRVADIMWTSYQIGDIDPRDASLLLEAVRILAPWFLWCVANYGVTAISEGEGFFRDIVTATGYSLGPYIMTKPITIALSHLLTRDEKSYIETIDLAAIVWIAILIIIHVQVTHNFSLKKTFGTAGLTLFGMICIITAAGLTYTLTDQIWSFVREIAVELTIRG